jgi:hypothetical protein
MCAPVRVVLFPNPRAKKNPQCLLLERESLWLSQGQMALLFDKDTDTIFDGLPAIAE